jgi:hypothetical protein
MHTVFLLESLRGRGHLEDLGNWENSIKLLKLNDNYMVCTTCFSNQ